MIFVTVGSHYHGFERLIRKMDEIAGGTDEKVIMQIGYTKYKPKNAEYFDFVESYKEIQELNQSARVVVCHDGAGSMITALQCGKLPIVVPRMKKYGEHTYENPADLAKELEKEGKIILVYDVNNIEEIIKNKTKKTIDVASGGELVIALKVYINNLVRGFKNKKAKIGYKDRK